MSPITVFRCSVNELLAAAAEEMLDVLEQPVWEPCGREKLEELVKVRLAAAADEILAGFETAIREYKQEIYRYRLLDVVLKPFIKLHRADSHQLLVCKEEWSPSLDQEEPGPPHIKEEQEELWTGQEGEQLPGLEEAHTIKVTLSPVPVKREEEEEEEEEKEENRSSQLHPGQPEENRGTEPPASSSSAGQNLEAEPSGGPRGGLEAAGNLDPAGGPEPSGEGRPPSSDRSEPEDAEDVRKSHTAQNRFSCTVCKNTFAYRGNLRRHMKTHTGRRERAFSCAVCKKAFVMKSHLTSHEMIHTRERPFGCTVCKKGFTEKSALKRHARIHTGERPYRCTVCKKDFNDKGYLKTHLKIHSGERPFGCSLCERGFARQSHLKRHMAHHTGEKPVSCTICKKGFARGSYLKLHTLIHAREPPPTKGKEEGRKKRKS